MKNSRKKKHAPPKKKRLGLLAFVLGGAAVAAFVGALLIGASSASKPADLTVDTGGRVQISEETFDAGDVPVNKEVEHKFTVTNDGTGPLNLGTPSVQRLQGC